MAKDDSSKKKHDISDKEANKRAWERSKSQNKERENKESAESMNRMSDFINKANKRKDNS